MRQVVENFRRSIAERRNGNGEFAVARDIGQLVFGPVSEIHFENLTLDLAANELHRSFAPVFVNEPLGEIIFEWYVEANPAHIPLLNNIQIYRKSAV